jgi:peptidoglycan/xylan/chitin deacetylase (PgdA/CDA1 family)
MGLAPVNYSKIKAAGLFFRGVFYNLNPFRGQDPWWNFDWMMNLEKRLGIRSTFFFLRQEDRFDNSLYKYHYKKIKALITKISKEGFEAGLHGTMRSATDAKNLLQQKSEFSRVTGIEPVGIRQHYLRFSHPLTFNPHCSLRPVKLLINKCVFFNFFAGVPHRFFTRQRDLMII